MVHVNHARMVAVGGVLALVVGGGAASFHAGSISQARPADIAGHGARSSAAVSATATTTSSATAANALSEAVVKAAAIVEPKVVLITSADGLGSGEVIDKRGYIVTNYHVLSGGQAQLAPPFSVTLPNGKTYRASVAGTSASDDLAVLKISAGTLKPIALGDSASLQVGQFVLAVGNPLGYAQTATFGIVSTLGRGLPENGPATFLPDLIQTSAPINPGNSGGALVNLQGQLVGIPTLAAQDPQEGGAAQGIGFAIPVDRVKFIVDQIIKHGKVVNTGRAYLGIGAVPVTPQLQAQYGLPVGQGVLVAQLTAKGPAARAGLRTGDIIVAIDGHSLPSYVDLLDALAAFQPNQQVTLQVVGTDGNKRTVHVTLGTLPANPS